ncbi:MAG TPA: Glu/Leu/Phe/Val dehydrogenase dimerization domain-containing protein, partial [Miltoncostaeaceae bacterium]|nr:Glu/Leu/Phe/Val dehydrogenase dimerization domain-containing protein [Miltoncostaeaceae bacterium]
MRILEDAAVGSFERVVHAVDEDCGLRAIVAVHSTAAGPAVGGTRFRPYPSDACATLDALRLAEGMTLKAAAAGLPVGGGKAVIVGDPERLRSPELWRAYAGVVDLFDGAYVTAEDVGTCVADMAALRRHTPHVLGRDVGAVEEVDDPRVGGPELGRAQPLGVAHDHRLAPADRQAGGRGLEGHALCQAQGVQRRAGVARVGPEARTADRRTRGRRVDRHDRAQA